MLPAQQMSTLDTHTQQKRTQQKETVYIVSRRHIVHHTKYFSL